MWLLCLETGGALAQVGRKYRSYTTLWRYPDFLFGAADVVFGTGGAAAFWADMRSDSPLLPKLVGLCGIAVCVASAMSGFGYVTGVLHLPLVIGVAVTLALHPSAGPAFRPHGPGRRLHSALTG